MNTPIQNLENDHIYILRLTDVMEKMVMYCSTNSSHFDMVVNLIENYADGFHHTKEENLLFPKLVQKGFSNEVGPVAVMLNDHTEGRNLVKAMSKGIAKFKAGDDTTLAAVYRNMIAYVELLRSHIGKENYVLFRMANHKLSTEEQADMLQQFTDVETREYGKKKIDGYITEIEGLEVAYHLIK